MMEYKRGKNKLTKMQSASNCISASSANAGPLVDAALQAASVEVEFPIVENLEIKVWKMIYRKQICVIKFILNVV